jgi:hypothetical protein
MRYFSIVVLGVAAMMSSGAVLAQHAGTRAEQSACSRDAQRFCRKDLGNDDAVQSCLQMKRASLSASCKKVFESHGM